MNCSSDGAETVFHQAESSETSLYDRFLGANDYAEKGSPNLLITWARRPIFGRGEKVEVMAGWCRDRRCLINLFIVKPFCKEQVFLVSGIRIPAAPLGSSSHVGRCRFLVRLLFASCMDQLGMGVISNWYKGYIIKKENPFPALSIMHENMARLIASPLSSSYTTSLRVQNS